LTQFASYRLSYVAVVVFGREKIPSPLPWSACSHLCHVDSGLLCCYTEWQDYWLQLFWRWYIPSKYKKINDPSTQCTSFMNKAQRAFEDALTPWHL